MLIVQAGIAIALSPALALIVIGFLIAGGIGLASAMRNARLLGGFVTRANLALLDTTTQFLGGLKLAISQNLQTSFVREFQETLRKLRERQLGFIRQRTRSRLAVATLVALVGALAVFVGIGILNTPSQIVIVILLVLARMNAPAMQLLQGAQQFANSLPAYEKIVELESELQPADAPKSADAVPQLSGPIVFRDVSFRYANGGGVNAIDLNIAPESFTGIAGESGSGKSTFADLLVGLMPPQQGEIRIGETALRGAALRAWRAQVSYVSQDPFLFHDTIRRNLEWANPSASESDIWRALDIAGAGTVVRGMRAGLETIAGERGTLISGGERQRVALARALLRNPTLLILDEATNAVDHESECKILERIRQAYPHMTIVMIAHSADSLRLCDRILRMEDGRLAEDHGETKRSHGALS
jgi:ATP-binding cassette subfamily C protein